MAIMQSRLALRESGLEASYLAQYTHEGHSLLACLLAGDLDPSFVLRMLDWLRTFTERPPDTIVQPQTLRVVVQMACTLYPHAQTFSYWSYITLLWPQVRMMALELSDSIAYAELTRQLAITTNAQGEAEAAQTRYEELLTAPSFDHLPARLRADILHQAGVCYVRQGQHMRAKQILSQCIHLVDDAAHTTYTEDLGYSVAPVLWHSKAFAYNQLGNVALMLGDVQTAHTNYMASLELFNAHDEEDNLACVAYDALGKLLLFQRRYDEAIPLLRRNLAIRRTRGERIGSANGAAFLAGAHLGAGDRNEAWVLLLEALQTFHDLNDRVGIALCHRFWGHYEYQQGNDEQALVAWQTALKMTEDIPALDLTLRLSCMLAHHQLSRGHFAQAVSALWLMGTMIRRQRLGLPALMRLIPAYCQLRP